MELADALSTTAADPIASRGQSAREGWYDPDSVAFGEGPRVAGLTRIDAERRDEIFAALPPGLRPLSLLVRVRRDGVVSR